jgi:hypothetical protein
MKTYSSHVKKAFKSLFRVIEWVRQFFSAFCMLMLCGGDDEGVKKWSTILAEYPNPWIYDHTWICESRLSVALFDSLICVSSQRFGWFTSDSMFCWHSNSSTEANWGIGSGVSEWPFTRFERGKAPDGKKSWAVSTFPVSDCWFFSDRLAMPSSVSVSFRLWLGGVSFVSQIQEGEWNFIGTWFLISLFINAETRVNPSGSRRWISPPASPKAETSTREIWLTPQTHFFHPIDCSGFRGPQRAGFQFACAVDSDMN